MPDLTNPIENTCYGCGPSNPRGLHLAFEHVGDAVQTSFVADAGQTGWPGLMHTGLHFTVLYEVSYWAALTLGGVVRVSRGPIAFDQVRLPRVGERCSARAVRVPDEGGAFHVRAVTTNAKGRECAVLESSWHAVTRAEVERWGVELPQYLLDDVQP